MNKAMKIILIILIVAAVLALGLWGYIRYSLKHNVLDGDDMVYRWTNYELYNTNWIELGDFDYKEPYELSFTRNDFTLYGSEGRKSTFSFKVPSDVPTEGTPSGEVYLELKNCDEFENLIFHEEQLEDGTHFPVLSGTVFEYDGRGEIIICEFVHKDDYDMIPRDYRSPSCISRNDREPVSMMKEVYEE